MTSSRAGPRVGVVVAQPFGEEGTFGGGERYALELAKALADVVPTRLVTFSRTSGSVCDGRLRIDRHRWWTLVRNERGNPLAPAFLTSLAHVDVIHCIGWHTLATDMSILFARATGRKVFVTDVGGGGSVSLARWLPMSRWADGLLLITEAGRHAIGPNRNVGVISGGVDAERFAPDGTSPARQVLFVGRILPHKGIDRLVDAMDPAVPLLVVGRPYRDDYYDLLRRASVGKNVTFITDATEARLAQLYRQSAVTVLPSVETTVYGDRTNLPELLGFAALESMACGTPVVCTAVTGLSEVVVDGETGYVVPPNDTAALSEKIALLLGDPALRERIGAAARRRVVERFSWQQVASRCLSQYEA